MDSMKAREPRIFRCEGFSVTPPVKFYCVCEPSGFMRFVGLNRFEADRIKREMSDGTRGAADPRTISIVEIDIKEVED
jgi:hypothetical protein